MQRDYGVERAITQVLLKCYQRPTKLCGTNEDKKQWTDSGALDRQSAVHQMTPDDVRWHQGTPNKQASLSDIFLSRWDPDKIR